MTEENKIRIIECKYSDRKDIIDFLIQITSNEFNHSDWKDYFEHKLVERYKVGKNNFWIVINTKNEIIGTCGALQQEEKIIKMNCFYLDAKYRNLGIGKKIYDLFIKFAEEAGYQEIILCTYAEFDRAIRFYEERGFELYETIGDEFWYRKKIKGWREGMEEEIMNQFLSINEQNCNPTMGKYSSKKETFFEDIEKWQREKNNKNHSIRPIQFTFEITNRCNCNCKDCGMSANSIKVGKTKIEENELYKLVDELYQNGIPAFAITGGEPFLEFENMCKMIKYSENKLDVSKIITNGFWGANVEYYFPKLEEAGLLKNQFFVPSMQVSIGEQTIPLEDICSIIHYVANHYTMEQLNFGIIHTRLKGQGESQLSKLYHIYLNRYGEFPTGRIYLTDSYYVNANSESKEKIETYEMTVYHAINECDNKFEAEVGKFVSPKIFMKCNGDCYPCEVFNMHKDMFLGNYFEIGIDKVLENFNSNKYIRFIRKYGTVGFREVIPSKVLKANFCETSCYGCEFCIKFCEKNNLIR